ncbi:epidermis-specific secreted glycoprotein EP1-like [Cornus florida]|uniref:epidermis-specific secreted glycoprotein EP1-like n=1 Tax=Cornus florida TaxID=4283 RepID=UPI00289AFA8A|nr:epidermis-specific secreted glycoprotein EP1-like [Cornus florida]
MSSLKPFMAPLFSLFLLSSFSISQASVPASNQFKFVNDGEFGPYIIEYDGNYRTLSVFNSPFQLCFYNTTPNAFTLALRMGLTRSESLFRWVWEANRGNPVRENATLTFGSDGNLVLADADGRIAWHTGTANKGVVGFKLLSNGNIVLYDSNNKFIWHSFDHPTDTLLVGQSLKAKGPTKLVSRASASNNVNGAYSLVLEPKWLALNYKSMNSPKPMLYFTSSGLFTVSQGSLEYVTFNSEPDSGNAYYLLFDYKVSGSSSTGNRYLARPKYNATLSFLRLGIDGNIKFYTYNDKVDIGAWEVTYTLFDRESNHESECQLPERCGKFGLCEDNQCVGCPKPNGLVGWSKDCEAVKVTSCGVNDFYYYKIVGVEHFMSKYTKGDGPMKENGCSNKCTKDCKCLGYFYHQDTSLCWIAYDLKTLTKVANSTHLGYIKAPKH